jgi:hypothetical protein
MNNLTCANRLCLKRSPETNNEAFLPRTDQKRSSGNFVNETPKEPLEPMGKLDVTAQPTVIAADIGADAAGQMVMNGLATRRAADDAVYAALDANADRLAGRCSML